MPSRAFTVKRIGGFHPVATSLVMSAFSSGITTAPAWSRNTTSGARSNVDAASIDEPARGRHLHGVEGVVGREPGVALAVEADAIEVAEIGVQLRLAPVGGEVDRARLLVHVPDVVTGPGPDVIWCLSRPLVRS